MRFSAKDPLKVKKLFRVTVKSIFIAITSLLKKEKKNELTFFPIDVCNWKKLVSVRKSTKWGFSNHIEGPLDLNILKKKTASNVQGLQLSDMNFPKLYVKPNLRSILNSKPIAAFWSILSRIKNRAFITKPTWTFAAS